MEIANMVPTAHICNLEWRDGPGIFYFIIDWMICQAAPFPSAKCSAPSSRPSTSYLSFTAMPMRSSVKPVDLNSVFSPHGKPRDSDTCHYHCVLSCRRPVMLLPCKSHGHSACKQLYLRIFLAQRLSKDNDSNCVSASPDFFNLCTA
jgi:hypothetical protein